jgi:hypothetical protein
MAMSIIKWASSLNSVVKNNPPISTKPNITSLFKQLTTKKTSKNDLNGHQAMCMIVPRQCTKQDHRLFLSILSLAIQLSEGAGIQLTGLTPPAFYACFNPGHGFPLSFFEEI